uniref:Uncharacterized protein n=1 Tax=Leersia perrieri TaxID=77586 RepID=A0A0D9WXE8_9ORYZ
MEKYHCIHGAKNEKKVHKKKFWLPPAQTDKHYKTSNVRKAWPVECRQERNGVNLQGEHEPRLVPNESAGSSGSQGASRPPACSALCTDLQVASSPKELVAGGRGSRCLGLMKMRSSSSSS